MTSIGEVKAQLSAASMLAGEAYGALQEAKEQLQLCRVAIQQAEEKINAAVAKAQEATPLAGGAFDGSSHDLAMTAFDSFDNASRDAMSCAWHMQTEVDENVKRVI